MAGTPGRRRRGPASRRRRLGVAAAALIVAASGLAGFGWLAGQASPRLVASRQGETPAGPVRDGAAHAAGGDAATPGTARAGGPPDGALSAAAAGPLSPAVVTAVNRDRHVPRPATSSAVGRFNVGQAHSPQLLRELSGPLSRTGRPSPAGAPATAPAPSSPAAPATPAPGAGTTPAPGSTAAPAPSQTAEANTTALVRPLRPLGPLRPLRPAGAVRPAGGTATMAQGIDVASFQHPGGAAINWAQVAGAGYTFAAVKGTEGNYYTNPYYAADVTGAKAAGLTVTGYHFAIPNVSGGVNQADYAVENGNYTADGHTLPLELDAEYDPYTSSDHTNECYGLTPGQMVSWISAFDGEVQRLTGQLPIIYSTADWWNTCTGSSTAFSADQLWIAAYSVSIPPLPAGWRDWTYWQYTSTGTVPGITGSTDVSYFNGGAVDLIDPGMQRTTAGTAVSLQIGSLNTGQALSFTASGLPAGLSISGTGQITGTMTAAAGANKVVVTATNPSTGATGSVSFLWEGPGTVTLTPPAAQGTAIGSPAYLQVAASDSAAGYVPSFTATGLPPGASISSAGRITGWPDATGTYSVTVTATDALLASGTASFTWTVSTASGQGPASQVWLQNGGRCLDDPGSAATAGTRLQIWACWGGASQRWTVAQDGSLRISGACAAEAGTGNGAAVQMAACDGSAGQRWQVGTGAQLINAASGKCLDDTGWRTANGTQLQVWACDGGSNQHWTPAAAPVMSGVAGKCADDPGWNTANGVRLDVWTCNGGANQDWTVQPDGTIRLAGKCLDVAGASTASGAQIDLYSCKGGSNQQWKLVPEGTLGSEVVNPVSGKCLADTGDSASNGTKLTIQACQAQDPGTVWHVL